MTRKGYKHTELGEIPEDWEVKTLGEVYSFKYGDGNTNPNNEGRYPVYGANGIIGGYTKFNAENSVVIGHMGEYAGSVIWASGKHFVTYNGTITKPKNTKTIDAKYGYYSLIIRNINNICAGSGYPFLAYDKLNIITISLPPLPEQRAIASALSDVDALIEALDRLIDKKRKIKQGTMQQLLSGKKRLKGFSKGKGYKHTELGEIPEDWEVKTLGEIGEVLMCRRIMKHQTTSHGDVPFYKIGTFGGQADSYISIKLYNEYKEKYSYPSKGAVLFSAAGTIGRKVIFNGKPSYFQDSNIVWIDNNELLVKNKFLYYCYDKIHWNTENGGVVNRLYNNNIKYTRFPLPSLPEQRAIASVLSDMDAEIEALEAKRNKYTRIKLGMMQDLLTGRVRLKF